MSVFVKAPIIAMFGRFFPSVLMAIFEASMWWIWPWNKLLNFDFSVFVVLINRVPSWDRFFKMSSCSSSAPINVGSSRMIMFAFIICAGSSRSSSVLLARLKTTTGAPLFSAPKSGKLWAL